MPCAVAEAVQPVAANVGRDRVLLLVSERRAGGDHRRHAEGARREGHGHAGEGRHVVIAARAPRITLSRTLRDFALPYALVAAVAALLAGWLQRRAVRGALAPLDRARAEAAEVETLGRGDRLTEQGPVEIRGLIASMNAVLGRLEIAHRAQSRFTAEAAHELRTPVTVMLGELDVANTVNGANTVNAGRGGPSGRRRPPTRSTRRSVGPATWRTPPTCCRRARGRR